MKISTTLLLLTYATVLLQVSVNDAMETDMNNQISYEKKISGDISDYELNATKDDTDATASISGSDRSPDKFVDQEDSPEKLRTTEANGIVVELEFYDESFPKFISTFEGVNPKFDDAHDTEIELGIHHITIYPDHKEQTFVFEITTKTSNPTYTVLIGQNSRHTEEESALEENTNAVLMKHKMNDKLFVYYKQAKDCTATYKLYEEGLYQGHQHGFLPAEDEDRFNLYHPKKAEESKQEDPKTFMKNKQEADDLKEFINKQKEKFLKIKSINWKRI